MLARVVLLGLLACALGDFTKSKDFGNLEGIVNVLNSRLPEGMNRVDLGAVRAVMSHPEFSLRATTVGSVCYNASISLQPSGCKSFELQSFTAMTQASVDSFCKDPCTGRYVLAFQTFLTACSAELGSSSPDGSLAATKILGSVVDMLCLKNNEGTYCMVLMSTMSQKLAAASQSCDSIKEIGCCLVSYMEWAQAIAGAGTDLSSAMTQLKDGLKDQCGITLPPGCNSVGAKLPGSVVLPGFTMTQYTALSASKKMAIKNAIAADIAAAAGISATQVTNVNIVSARSVAEAQLRAVHLLAAGDVKATFDITAVGVSAATKAKAALTNPISFPTVKAEAGLSTTPSGTAETGSVEQVSTNTAARAAASFALVALSAFLALFL
mmetsp:Transcript_10622/g.24166  ORF Transcript_10622/g.24166 Transcript_10622/m.24166 type:complete len:381 (+) Transcript_10622:59-1201(+)